MGNSGEINKHNSTIIMLGAGSSHSYGFPLANGLGLVMLLGIEEAEKELKPFAEYLTIGVRTFKSHLGKTKEIVERTISEEYATLDAALFEYLKREKNSVSKNNLSKVFWNICGRAFVDYLDKSKGSGSPNNALSSRVKFKLASENLKSWERDDFHIDILSHKYPEKLEYILNSIVIDYNYDNWFPYRLSYLNNLKDHTIEQLALNDIAALKLQISVLKKKQETYEKDKNSLPMAQILHMESRPSEMSQAIERLTKEIQKIENNSLAHITEGENINYTKIYQPLRHYIQPHGSFLLHLGKRGVYQDQKDLFWKGSLENEYVGKFPSTCHEITEQQKDIFEQLSGVQKNRISTLLVLGISPNSFKQNTQIINFPRTISQVLFTCLKNSDEVNFTNILKKKFPNASLSRFKKCHNLWDSYFR